MPKALIGIVIAAVIGVVAIVVLSSGDDDPTTTTTTAGSAATAPQATTTTAGTTSGSCEGLTGTWRLQDQVFFDAMTEASGEGVFEHLGGDFVVSFAADGTFAEERSEWRFRVTSADGVIEVETDGVTPGTWSSDGDTFEVATSEGTMTGEMWILEDGELVPLPISGDAGLTGFVSTGTFECVGDVLSLHIEEETVVTVLFDRVG